MKLFAVCCFLFCLFTAHAFAQLNETYFNSKNTIGVVNDNPAFAVSSDNIQANLVGGAFLVGTNVFVYKIGILSALSGAIPTSGSDFSKREGTDDGTCWGNLSIQGPGVSFKIKQNFNFAVTSGVRCLFNIDHLSNAVLGTLGANQQSGNIFSDTLQLHNFALAAQVFREINLTYAGDFFQSENHNITGGCTIKLLSGGGAIAAGIPNLVYYTHYNNGIAFDAAGNGSIAYTSGAEGWALDGHPFNALSGGLGNFGLGANIGVIYEYRQSLQMIGKEDYTIRLGVSITDIGSISYRAGSGSGAYEFTGSQIQYRNIGNSAGNNLSSELSTYAASGIIASTASTDKFNVGLPTALRINSDLRVEKQLFINSDILVNLRSPSAQLYSNHYITTVTITTRYEWKNFSIGVPFSFNAAKQGYIGTVLQAGPVFVGSGSCVSSTFAGFDNFNVYGGIVFAVK